MDNLNLHTFLIIKPLLQGGVIACELGLCHPLRGEDERLIRLLSRDTRWESENQKECQEQYSREPHLIRNLDSNIPIFIQFLLYISGN